jgi:GT2 family glycosyltransferase/glycosyltransferase involved in cell wall biosynthesis
VSVIVLNYRRPEDTLACLAGLRELDWPSRQLEVIVVDNASGDGSADHIRGAAPDVQVLELAENTGFAGGCNRGAALATGAYLGFINNDARPDPQWVRAAVRVLTQSGSVACVASKVLDWEGRTIDFADANLTFYGHGFKLRLGKPDAGTWDAEHDVLFASGAAMIVDADIFRSAGGFDERYFMFFEDVDLGWRLWVLGYRVRYVPASVAFHRHHASMAGIGSWREHYLLERNALFTIFKNYDDANLHILLAPALALAVRRGIALGGDDPHALDLQRSATDDGERLSVHKHTLAAAFAVDAFVEALPGLVKARQEIQARRRRPDFEILPLFREPLQSTSVAPYFLKGLETTVEAFRVRDVFAPRRRVLVATADTLRPAMAGPAIRAWHIALALAREHEVELVSPTACDGLDHPDFRVRKVSPEELRQLVDWCDIIVFQGYLMHEHPAIATSSKIVVVDIYDPFHLEQLEQERELGYEQRRRLVQASVGALNQQLSRGDFFICASEKQRDFWLGHLSAVGRINPRTYDSDETLGGLVAVAPFGVSDIPPCHSRRVLKGVVPGIGPEDKVILWGGGVYDWLDPLTLVRAIDRLRRRLPKVRLYFLGMRHPNPHVAEMRMAVETRRLARDLSLTDVHVFFNEAWVEYDDRQNYLLEADVGVSTHLAHVESEFAFRTRILDCFWAALPVVVTRGDALAELIGRQGAGLTVKAGDIDGLEEALYTLLTDDALHAECRRNAVGLAERLRWSKVLEPLVEFCRSPRRAPDLVDPSTVLPAGLVAVPPRRERPWQNDLRAVVDLARRGDYRMLARKVVKRGRRALWRSGGRPS